MLDCQLSEANVNDPNRLNDQTTDEDAGEGKAKRMGFREKLEIKRMEKAARMGPDPWLTRKVSFHNLLRRAKSYSVSCWILIDFG